MARQTGTFLSDVYRFRNLIIVVLTPILLLPLPLTVDGPVGIVCSVVSIDRQSLPREDVSVDVVSLHCVNR